jgi:hypothetical protein
VGSMKRTQAEMKYASFQLGLIQQRRALRRQV